MHNLRAAELASHCLLLCAQNCYNQQLQHKKLIYVCFAVNGNPIGPRRQPNRYLISLLENCHVMAAADELLGQIQADE